MFKYLRKLKLKKLGIHIDSVDQLNKGLNLEVESPCWINGARLSTYDDKVKKIGAYTSEIKIKSSYFMFHYKLQSLSFQKQTPVQFLKI